MATLYSRRWYRSTRASKAPDCPLRTPSMRAKSSASTPPPSLIQRARAASGLLCPARRDEFFDGPENLGRGVHEADPDAGQKGLSWRPPEDPADLTLDRKRRRFLRGAPAPERRQMNQHLEPGAKGEGSRTLQEQPVGAQVAGV